LAQAAVARHAWWAIVGEVIVAVDIRSGQQVERMPAVVGHNRRQFEARQETRMLRRTFDNCRNHNLVPLIEIRDGPLSAQT
jgi:hypothetical protein